MNDELGVGCDVRVFGIWNPNTFVILSDSEGSRRMASKGRISLSDVNGRMHMRNTND
jgi:hypothetical protein